MPAVETMTFRLRDTADEAAFLEADGRVQTDFAYHQPGLLRRTIARNAQRDWIVVDLWRSEADADACAERSNRDPVASAFMVFVDEGTLRVERYATLD